MTMFHEKTLSLLGGNAPRPQRSVQQLTKWAEQNCFTLPVAFLQWAQLDDGSLLQKYSNDDWFWFDDPEVVAISGGRALRFNSENQGNFDRLVMLDSGDDPPVLFGWVGQPPWVTYTERFSDAIFAQIFDWQYWLEFYPDDPAQKSIAYTGDISLPVSSCIDVLRSRYDEAVQTSFIVDDKRFREYRFSKSPTERFTAMVAETSGATEIRITAASDATVAALEAEWLDILGTDVRPREFSSVSEALSFLGRRIDRSWLAQIRYACINKPDRHVIERLCDCHRESPLKMRASGTFPKQGPYHVVRCGEWPIVIRFLQKNLNRWQIESIAESSV